MRISKRILGSGIVLSFVLALAGAIPTFAQENARVQYVPLIGITSVPDPLALPDGAGNVTYYYAVKNFVQETALMNVHVVDDTCSPVTFVEGDDNKDSKLDYIETWRYVCTVKRSLTTQSNATATGSANGMTATHSAYATVVVGQKDPAPLVSIINVTKIAYPLTLPAEGGDITFTYRVNNPGVVPLNDVRVVDDKCRAMSNKLGDTNNNNSLDLTEVWVFTCRTHLTQTTTNTVSVTASANGLKAVGYATVTVTVAPVSPAATSAEVPRFPTTGSNINTKDAIWGILSGVLAGLVIFSVFSRVRKGKRMKKNQKSIWKIITISVLLAVTVAGVVYFIVLPKLNQNKASGIASGELAANVTNDALFGWKYPTVEFPLAGSAPELAYSDIRDPGGIPQGLPVRLKIPVIGVNSAIEDALITPEGRMDVPAGSVNVAWFALGPHPGQVGSAVIGGHFGIQDGIPFVFYKLDTLKEGDKVYVEDDKGNTLTFVVRSIALFDRNADATTVFTSKDGLAHLNLITCEGVWNQVNGIYPERRVVFTDAIPSESAASTRAKLIARAVAEPALPTTAIPAQESPSVPPVPASKVPVSAFSGLFATPLDGFITSFLSLAILFCFFNIFRRRFPRSSIRSV